MNTQNVNVKTATKESTERWVENLLANAISEQKSLLLHLVDSLVAVLTLTLCVFILLFLWSGG